MSKIKCQNLVIFSLKTKIKQIFTTKYNKKSKCQQYFHCFIVFILFPYDFSLANSRILSVTILISTNSEVRRLLEGKRFFEGGAYFNVDT